MKKSLFTALATILVLVCHALAAHYPIEIIQPQEGLDTKSRFYKAYPGIEYKVNVAVIGGAFPFQHELVAAPSGMTIDQNKGIITWPSPTTAGSPHLVSVKVTDQEGSIDAHTWTITVTTDGFLFIDAANGKTRAEGGTGTIDNPFKGIAGWYSINTQPEDYNAKYENSYPGYFVYYKSGVYNVPNWQEHNYLNIYQDRKPKVHMAFPGHKPVFDVTESYFAVESSHNNYWEGFEFRNIVNPGRHAVGGGGGNNNTFVRNVFHGMSYKSGSYNQSPIMYGKSNANPRNYIAIMDNEFYDLEHGYCVLVYSTNKSVFERNWAHSINPQNEAHHCIGLKHNASQWFIRNNQFTDLHRDTEAIWLYYEANTDVHYDQVEASYNLVLHEGSGYALVLGNGASPYGDAWIFRNTFVGSQVRLYMNSATDGPVQVYNNVIVNTGAISGGSSYENEVIDHCVVTRRSGASGVTPQFNDNVTGIASDGIVEANGMLTSAYSQYIGTHGHYLEGFSASVLPVSQQVWITKATNLTQAYDILGRKIPTAVAHRALARTTGIVLTRNQKNVASLRLR